MLAYYDIDRSHVSVTASWAPGPHCGNRLGGWDRRRLGIVVRARRIALRHTVEMASIGFTQNGWQR